MKNKILTAAIGTMIFFNMLLAVVSPVFAVQNSITISSKEDFVEFSQKCTLDTWSQGKTVNLTCDVDFNGTDFAPVPTFGGTFNGNGHTVSGIKFSKSGSYMGIFRHIQRGGKIKDLNVKAEFILNGSKCFVGGVAGENQGALEFCSFEGIVKGQDVIGGIAGNNADCGQIIGCTSGGSISGENSVGGIAGKNSGFIQNCINNAAVNTVYEEKKNDISNIDTDTGAIVENFKKSSEEREEETILGDSDTGGIVGYSSGIVQGCVNNASVGYQHIGYNIGGVAGRQSGYMLGCKNYGFIQGRKDVGGIVGQVEPYILLNVSEGGLKNIRQELNNLNQMVNRFLTDTDNLGMDAEKHLTEISEHSKKARDNAKILLDQGDDFVEDNIGEINAQSAILSNTLYDLVPVFESLENAGADFTNAADEVIAAIERIKSCAPDMSNELDDIKNALEDISSEKSNINKAVAKAKMAIQNLDDAIEFGSAKTVNIAKEELAYAINDIVNAEKRIRGSIETIENILQEKPESFEKIGIDAKTVSQSIKAIRKNIDTILYSLQTIEKSINTIVQDTETDFTKFQSAAENMVSSIDYLEEAINSVSDGLDSIGESSQKMYEKADDADKELREAADDLDKGLKSLSYAVDDITVATGGVKDIIEDLSEEETVEFKKLGDDFKTASDGLFNSLSDISGEIENLKNIVSRGRNDAIGNLSSISNQFNLVMNLMVDEFESLRTGVKDISDIFLDSSDEDIENTKQGKVEECHNFGIVSADRSAGGIAGAMAVEYAKDPEDDIEKPDALNFTYMTKAVIKECINDGKISGKKDCIGGIIGISEIGTVYECQNYAYVESTNGNYVGGIAGKSESAIRKSYAKNRLAGKRYVGGIAGKADMVTACYVIVNVDGDESLGAICGDAENDDHLYRNFYVDAGLGAVDGISYKEKAMPVTFEELKTMSFIPSRFISFTVTFIADDEIVETQDIKYGDDTARIKYPEIPEKKGCFGEWQKVEDGTVTENIEVLCEYKPFITIIESEEKSKTGGLALALCEGEFTDKAELHVKNSAQKPPVNEIGDVKVYDISLLNTDIKDDDTVKVRILNENKDKVTAWVSKNGNWEKVKVAYRGKYVIMETMSNDSAVCLKYEKREMKIILIIIISAIILLSSFLFLKRKYRKTA